MRWRRRGSGKGVTTKRNEKRTLNFSESLQCHASAFLSAKIPRSTMGDADRGSAPSVLIVSVICEAHARFPRIDGHAAVSCRSIRTSTSEIATQPSQKLSDLHPSERILFYRSFLWLLPLFPSHLSSPFVLSAPMSARYHLIRSKHVTSRFMNARR